MLTLEREIGVLAQRYSAVRKKMVEVCRYLEIEDFVIQPEDFVSPIKWHLAHTTWFFETMVLKVYMPGYKLFHSKFDYFFNSYYESLGERVQKNHRGTLSRPTVKEVFTYRKYVDENIYELLLNLDQLVDEQKLASFFEVLELGIQHEQQHLELAVYDIKYILYTNPLQPAYFKQQNLLINERVALPPISYVFIPEGIYEVGYRGSEFAWDNEKPVHKVFLQNFKIADRLITNAEYMEFIRDGGYSNFKYWLDDGWRFIKEQNIKAPLYWEHKDGQWFEYTLYGAKEVNPSSPVAHISFYEAAAFAAWAGKRLPNELEWEITARNFPSPLETCNLLERLTFQPIPLQNYTKGQLHQLIGDVWEWTSSAYQSYPGYKAYEGPLSEYNGKFMVNQIVLRGGSCATPQDRIRSTYRNFFQPIHRWMFSGIRLAD